jgi:hypothetical protein
VNAHAYARRRRSGGGDSTSVEYLLVLNTPPALDEEVATETELPLAMKVTSSTATYPLVVAAQVEFESKI